MLRKFKRWISIYYIDLVYNTIRTSFKKNKFGLGNLLGRFLLMTHKNSLNWWQLSKDGYLPEKVVNKYINRVNIELILLNYEMSDSFLIKYVDHIKDGKLPYNSLYPPMSFITDYSDYINIDTVLRTNILPPDFIRKHIANDTKRMHTLSHNRYIPIDILREYKSKLSWGVISYMRSFTDEEIEEFKDYIDPFRVKMNNEHIVLSSYTDTSIDYYGKYSELWINDITKYFKIGQPFTWNELVTSDLSHNVIQKIYNVLKREMNI